MKKSLIIALFAIAGAAMAAETVAHWDFTKEQLVSGKYTMLKRGEAEFVVDEKSGKKVLSPCKVGKHHSPKGCGLTLKGNPQTELLPMDGFELQTRIRYKDPAAGKINGVNMYIVDAAYASKTGAALLLHITQRGQFMVRIIYGDGAKLHHVLVNAPMLGDGEWHNVDLRYADDKLAVIIDGKEVKSVLPAKPLADSKVRFTIGDRVASSYQPFTGFIEFVKVIKL